MTCLNALIDAYLTSREFDAATLSRLNFWSIEFGHLELDVISENLVA